MNQENMTTETKANDVITGFNGLTKREYFAGLAMQALIPIDPNNNDDNIAYNACKMADALIRELNASM